MRDLVLVVWALTGQPQDAAIEARVGVECGGWDQPMLQFMDPGFRIAWHLTSEHIEQARWAVQNQNMDGSDRGLCARLGWPRHLTVK